MSSIFEPGMLINDRVELVKFREEGGQGEIWEVRDREFPTHKNLALKLHYTLWEKRGEREFQRREIRLKAEIDLIGEYKGTYIIAPHFLVGGLENVDGNEYAIAGVVMDLATEGSLLSFYQTDAFAKRNSHERVVFLEHLAKGLRVIQHHGIVHNDIKPANILINDEAGQYRPRYADFGYAFKRGDPVVWGGTYGYMAPEVFSKEAEPSFESDVYSLGMTFYEMLIRRHPLDDIMEQSDQMRAIRAHYNKHDFIDSGPLRELGGPALVKLILGMCSPSRTQRYTIEEVLQDLETIAREAKVRVTPLPEDTYPHLANRFRWSEAAHRAFGESERIIFLKGARALVDPTFLMERLARERLHGYSIFRLLGASDYLLRIWRSDADQEGLDSVLHAYKANRGGGFEVFTPSIRRPQSSRAAAAKLSSPAAVIALLLEMAESDTTAVQLQRFRSNGLFFGETKAVREKGKRRDAVRVICRLRTKAALNAQLAEVIADKIYETCQRTRGLKQIEVLANRGDEGHQAEFILIGELDDFHRYGGILQQVEQLVADLTTDGIEEFRSLFEMDATSFHESHDGRLLHELYRHRTRRGR